MCGLYSLRDKNEKNEFIPGGGIEMRIDRAGHILDTYVSVACSLLS